MPQQVEVNGEILEFPDGMSDEDISAAIETEYAPKVQAEPQAPAPLKADDKLGLQLGLKRPLDNAALWINKIPGAQAVDRFMAKNLGLPTAEEAAAATQADVDQAATEGRRPGMLGQFVGSVPSAMLLAAVTKNPGLLTTMGTGAATSALQTNDPNNPVAVLKDAGVGAVTAGGTDIALRGAGAVIAPKLNPMVQRLLDAKVDLTPGQMLGGMVHRTEDAARSLLGLGDMITSSQAQAQRTMNKAAWQEALDQVGVKIPDAIEPGFKTAAFAQKTLSDRYTNVLNAIDNPPTGGVGGVAMDQPFVAEIQNLIKLTRGLPADQRHVFDYAMKTYVTPAFTKGARASGHDLKELDEYLGKQVVKLDRSQNPYDGDVADALRTVQFGIREMIGRQHPNEKAALDALNYGWSLMLRPQKAAAKATNGIFTATELKNVTTGMAQSKGMAARGEARGQEFANAADSVMHPTLGDSGTATRQIPNVLAGSALFGQGLLSKQIEVNPWAAMTLGALAAPYAGKTAGNITRALIAGGQGARRPIREAIEASRKPAASAFAGVPGIDK